MRWFRAGTGRRGVAAIEFAILMPVLVTILTALSDVTNATLTFWKLAQAADCVGRVATSLAVANGNTNVLTQDQARIAASAALPLLPSLGTSKSLKAGVALTVVVFTPSVAGCTQNCIYLANVAWSASMLGGLPARPCGQLAPVPDSARPSPTTLAASSFTASSVLVVDVAAEMTPSVTALLGTVFRASVAGVMAARAGGPADWVRLSGPTAASLKCSGYT